MRCRCIILLISLLVVVTGHAQDDEMSGMLATLRTAKDDTAKINLLHDIQNSYLDVDNDSALYYNKQAEALIDKLQAGSQRYRCYHAFVKIYHALFDNENALKYCLKSIDIANENKDLFQKANSYRALFSLYFNLHKKDSAIKYSAYAIDLTERIRDTNNLATMYGNVSRIYQKMDMYDKAIEYGKKGVEAGTRYTDNKGLLVSMNNLGNAYLSASMYQEAIAVFEELLVAGKKYKRIRSVANALMNLGTTYFSLADVANHSRITRTMRDMESEFDPNDISGTSYRYLTYADDYILQEKFELAEKEAMKAVDLSTKDSILDALQNAYITLAIIKYAQHDFAKASYYDDKWMAFDEKARKAEMQEYSLDLEKKYQTQAKEDKIKLQQSQLRQQRSINFILIGSAIALLVIVALLFNNYRNRQKLQQQRISELEKEKQLTATEAVLKGEEKERSRLAKDLHDGLGSMLSGIKYSLGNMKGNLLMTPDNAQALERSIDMLDSSIREMRRVAHNMMPEALVKFGLDTALKDFCNDITQSGALRVNYQSIGLQQAELDQTMAITIYRIVQELVNNAIKHAQARTVIVQVSKTNNELSVTVEDDGQGFDSATLTKSSMGMGWDNIRNRVEFLKGNLDVKSGRGEGTSVLIEIKL